MNDLIALITIIIWPVVPLFWIPVHGLSKRFGVEYEGYKKLIRWRFLPGVL
ncbi:MAG: hypothetical protein Q7T83_13225 [Thermodesulfovibrionales bacterium]|nr:hypothetical protein [Thermodesulfovibrionales bacterium]MDP3110701.1 hypothetical protein [Thermodesulfovibrionales bacterium]